MSGGKMTDRQPLSMRRRRIELCASAAVFAIVLGVSAAGAQSYKATHVMVSNNNGFINDGPGTTDVVVNTTNTVVQWTVTDPGTGTFDFQDAGSVTTFSVNGSYDYTVLNVVNIDPSRAIRFNGTTNSLRGSAPGGNIWFYSPGGIILSNSSSFNVGSLLLTTSTPSNQTANFVTGSIGLSGAPNTASAITIQAGASITANNYIAMVAPHIDQGGTVRANGQIAYVAAEAANLTFPVGGSNLFTIDISTGSDAVNAQGQVLVHTGTTGGPGTGPDRDIYFVAMPKNTAITTLLGGSIGYDAASAAVSSEGIYLVGGGVILNGVPYRDNGPDQFPGRLDEIPSNLTITSGANFLQDVTAYATNITTQAAGGDVVFAKSATLFATLTNTLSVGSGLQIASGGSLAFYARGRDNDDSLIGGSVTATIAGTLRAGANTLSASGLSFNGQSSGADNVAGTVTGGTVAVSVVGGTIQTGTGGLSLNADSFGGFGETSDGSGAIGGSATLSLAGTISSGGGVTLSANGNGGGAGHSQSGTGVGGLARLTAAPGSGVTTPSINSGGVLIQANGLGGSAYCDTCSDGALGGNGTGGSAVLSLSDTNATASSFSLSAAGEGGTSWQAQDPAVAGKGGDGAGGLASAGFTRGTITTSGISVVADGIGAAGGRAVGSGTGQGGAGGTGAGGRIADGNGALLNFSGSTLLSGEGVGILLSANGTGGLGGSSAGARGGDGGAATGGDASYTQDQLAQINDASMRLSAVASGGNGGSPGATLDYSNGGDGTGGSTRFFASGGSLFTGDLTQSAGTAEDSGFGGGLAIPGFHGSMQGGTSSTAIDSATVNLTSYLADTSADSSSEGGVQYHDAFVSGGTASVSVSGGGSLTATTGMTFKTYAVEMGGDAGAANGVAGGLQIQTLTGGTITSANTQIDATGSGGFSSTGGGGNGVGGTVVIEANSGAINLGTALIDASANSGTGVGGGAQGTGGSVTIDTANGGLISASGGLTIDTRATIFANNNTATGGTITLTAADGQFTIGGLTANASGSLNNNSGVSSGGAISINATGTSVLSRPSSFGDTDLVTTGATNPGTINIRNGIADGGSPMSFGTLSALANGPTTDPLMQVVSVGSAITANSATFNTNGGLFFSSLNDGTFSVANALNATAGLFVLVDLGGGSAIPTIQADNLNFTTNTFNALGTTILKATTGLSINASGPVTARTLTAGNSIAINSARDVTVDSATVTNPAALISGALDPTVSALEIDAGYSGTSPVGAGNITINTAATARGSLLLKATRDITIGAGANIRSDNALTLSAGDDISAGAGATVTGAANPLNSGTGFASILAGDGSGPVEVHSLINAGTISANAAQLTLTADAIQSTGTVTGRTISANLLVDSSTGNDGGTLSANCVAGTICVGTIASTGNVTIGTTGRTPTTTRLTGNVNAATLDVRASGGIFLGGATPTTMTIAGPANFNAGTQSLNDLGTVSIQAASIAVTAGNDIAASATSFQSTGDITLAVGRNIFAADLIAGARLGPGHVALTGQLTVSGRIAAGTGGIDFTAPGGISLNRVTLGNGTPLTLDSGSAALAITDASPFAGARAGTVSLSGGTITVGRLASTGTIGLTGSGLVQVTTDLDAGGSVTASGAGIALTSVAGPLTIASATSTANLALTSGGALTLVSGNASGTTTLNAGAAALTVNNSTSGGAFTATSGGTIGYGSITASQATLTGAIGITVGTLNVGSGGTANLTTGGAIAGTGQFTAGGGLSLTGGSINLTTPGALTLASVQATAGDLTLNPGGALTINSGGATGNATINGSTSVAIGSLIAGGNLVIAAPSGLTFNQLTGSNVSLGASGGQIDGQRLAASGTTTLTAGGLVQVSVDLASTGPVTASGAGIALTSAAGPLDVSSATSTSDIVLASGGALSFTGSATGPITLSAGAAGLTVGTATSGGAFTANSAGNIDYSSIGASQAALTAAGNINGGQLVVTGSGTATFMAGGSIFNNGQLRADGGLSVTGGSVNLTTPGALNLTLVRATAGDVTLSPTGALTVTSGIASGRGTINGGGDVTLAAFTTGGDLTVTTPGAINFGSLTSNNNIFLTSSGGLISGSELNATNAASLTAATGVQVNGNLAAAGGLSFTGPSVSLTSLGSLTVTSAVATDSTVDLRAAGNLIVQSAVAPGGITLVSTNGDVSAVSAASGGAVTITAGRGIGFNTIAGASANFTASNGDISGGALSVAGKAALQASGAIRLTDPVATGMGTLPNFALAGVNDSLGNGGDLVINAGGAILINNAVAGGRALLTGGGAVSIGQLRSGGDLTILTPGNIGFSSIAGNAVNLTSSGATISGDALAASYTTNLSSVGLLQVTNLSSADLVTGRGSRITLLGTSPLSLASLTSGGAVLVTAGGLTINGAIQGTTIDLGSQSIAIGPAARIGTAGTTTGVTFRNTGTGRSFIGATGTGYSLAAAGLARVQADTITLVLPQASGSSASQPDVVIGDVTLHGSTGTASGTLANLTSAGSFVVQTPGRVQVAGKLLLTDIAAGNGASITAGQAIDVVTPGGSILLTDTAGAAQGTLTLVSPRITVASAQAITDLASLTTLTTRDARLARNDGAVTEQGYVVGGHLVFRISDVLDIQNSGGTDPIDRRGVTAGTGGIDVVATGSVTPEVILNGRQAAAGGLFTAGSDLLPLVHFASTLSTVNASSAATVNGCTPTSCLAIPRGSSFVTGMPPTQDVVEWLEDSDGTEQTLPDATRPLIETTETAPFSFAPVVDEPVVGIGTESVGIGSESGISTGPENGNVPQNGSISTGPENGPGGVPQNGNISTGPAGGGAGGAAQNGNLSTGPANGEPGGVPPNGGPGNGGGNGNGPGGIPQNGSISTGPADTDRGTTPPQR